MSGDPEPKNEPKIFYSEEMTPTKLIVLKQPLFSWDLCCV